MAVREHLLVALEVQAAVEPVAVFLQQAGQEILLQLLHLRVIMALLVTVRWITEAVLVVVLVRQEVFHLELLLVLAAMEHHQPYLALV